MLFFQPGFAFKEERCPNRFLEQRFSLSLMLRMRSQTGLFQWTGYRRKLPYPFPRPRTGAMTGSTFLWWIDSTTTRVLLSRPYEHLQLHLMRFLADSRVVHLKEFASSSATS